MAETIKYGPGILRGRSTWTFPRCRFCGDYGVFTDTGCCDFCEEQVLMKYPEIVKARATEQPALPLAECPAQWTAAPEREDG